MVGMVTMLTSMRVVVKDLKSIPLTERTPKTYIYLPGDATFHIANFSFLVINIGHNLLHLEVNAFY